MVRLYRERGGTVVIQSLRVRVGGQEKEPIETVKGED
jgi:hypothetical protein